jgi:hypothetical protein
MAAKKREWWPIGIVAAFAVFIGGIGFAVGIMMRNDVPLTSADYYAQEIAYQSQIDKSSRGLAPAHKPALKVLPATQALEIQFPGDLPAMPITGKVVFFRPSDPGKDFSATLLPDSNGVQWVALQGKARGLWVVQLEWRADGVAYYYEEQILI